MENQLSQRIKEISEEQPPSRLDPAPERPTANHLLDPFEESEVEISDFFERRRERLGAEYAASLGITPDAKKEVSEAQLAANRANAQLSTGPKTSEGQAISSRNHFRHGLTQTEGDLVLLENESKDEYSRSLTEFQEEWKPTTATERDLVERLASRQWLRRRAMRLQKRYIDDAGYIMDYEQFGLYRRYELSHERAFNKALADLMRLRSLRLREQNGFESQRRKNEELAFRIRILQNREKLQELAQRAAEAKAKLAERKLELASDQKTTPPAPATPPIEQINPDTETYAT